MAQRPWRSALPLSVLLAIGLVALAPSGCVSGTADTAGTPPAEDELTRAAADLDALYKDLRTSREAETEAPKDYGTLAPRRPAAPPAAPSAAPMADASAPPPATTGPASPAPMVFTPTAQEPDQTKRDRLIAELTSLLARNEAAPGRGEPLTRAIDLTILESLRAGGAAPSAALASLRAQLPPPQVELLDVLRELLAAAPRHAGGDASALSAMLSRAAERLQSSGESLRIPVAALCARVESFGRYTPLPTRMVAGRRHAALVYVEVANFAHRPVSQTGGESAEAEEFVVELSQELTLFHDADGLAAWRKPEQAVREVSRNRRRDYFLVQRIDLPPTLTIGKYILKVNIRDKATGAQAQASIPIALVADESTLDRPVSSAAE